MGTGIAQLAAMTGHEVKLHDVSATQLSKAGQEVDRSLARFVKAGKMTETDADASRSRISHTGELSSAVADADVIVEAVPEILELKQQVLAEVLTCAPSHALLGTNTSQLSITKIGAELGPAASRLVGLHFFNPPVMMRLVELIAGLQTAADTLDRARAFATRLGREVVVCRKDSPGFITSRAYAILRLECVRMLEEGIATADDIDTALKLGFNFPMGPLELGDMNGLDTFLHALDGLSEAHGDRFRPTVGLRNMVAAGRHGRKSGLGYYAYDAEGRRV
jgi:3-hydroxybutyryl-CoA dehydrogenase